MSPTEKTWKYPDVSFVAALKLVGCGPSTPHDQLPVYPYKQLTIIGMLLFMPKSLVKLHVFSGVEMRL